MTLVNTTWLDLKPNEDNDGNQEWFEEYYERIKLKRDYRHIPKDVFEQWIHPHHKNEETLINYAWIDLSEIEFVKCKWDISQFLDINIIEDYQDYFVSRSSLSDFNQFCCTDSDLNYWKKNGTWRVPPIVLDVNSLRNPKPVESELHAPFQLVEGHSRLGYLNSVKRISKLNKGNIAPEHYIFLMRQKAR